MSNTKSYMFVSVVVGLMGLGWVFFAMGKNDAAMAGGDALRLSWKINVGNNITKPPVIAEDKVIIVPHKSKTLTALNALTGRKAWEFHHEAGIFNNSVKYNDGQVFFCLKGKKLIALDARDGSEQWRIDLGINCIHRLHVHDDTLYVPTANRGYDLPLDLPLTGAKLYSVNRRNGQVNWVHTSGNYFFQSPTSNHDTIFAGGSYYDPDFPDDEGGPDRFQAFDPKTGEVKWTYESIDGFVKKLYATDERLIYLAYEDFLYGLDAKTGKRVWKQTTGNWTPSFLGHDDVVYFGSATTDVYAWSVKDGKGVWRFNIPEGKFNYLLRHPAIKDDRIYFNSRRGEIFALTLDKGEKIWRYETGKRIRMGLTVANGHIYLGDRDGNVLAYKILK